VATEYAAVAQQESAELATWNERNADLAKDLSTTVAVRSGDVGRPRLPVREP